MAKRFSLVPFLPLSLPLASSCLVPLCLVILALLAPKTPAQLLPPTTSWQPPAMIPAQVNPPEVIDVVAVSYTHLGWLMGSHVRRSTCVGIVFWAM